MQQGKEYGCFIKISMQKYLALRYMKNPVEILTGLSLSFPGPFTDLGAMGIIATT